MKKDIPLNRGISFSLMITERDRTYGTRIQRHNLPQGNQRRSCRSGCSLQSSEASCKRFSFSLFYLFGFAPRGCRREPEHFTAYRNGRFMPLARAFCNIRKKKDLSKNFEIYFAMIFAVKSLNVFKMLP